MLYVYIMGWCIARQRMCNRVTYSSCWSATNCIRSIADPNCRSCQGCSDVIICMTVPPKLHTSAFTPSPSCRNTSGAMNAAVPQTIRFKPSSRSTWERRHGGEISLHDPSPPLVPHSVTPFSPPTIPIPPASSILTCVAAVPKSASLTSPDSPTKQFCALRSLCTMPRE